MSIESVSLSDKDFEDFIRCLSVIKDICSDADIRGGIIRQKTNDAATVFEINMTPLIEDLSIPLVNLKQKIDLLKIFSGQDVTIETIEEEDEDQPAIIFSDEFSKLKLMGPTLEYMDNKFMSQEELETIFSLNEEDVILSKEIDHNISERMKVIAQSFNVNTTNVIFDGENASIEMHTQSQDQSVKILSNIIVEQPMSYRSSLVNTPFIIDHDDTMVFKMYNYEDQVCSNQFSTSIKDVEITVFSRSNLVEV